MHRSIRAALFCLFLCALGCESARARDNSAFAVHDIAVDATAGNASDARQQAVTQGARKGLEALLRSLVSPEDAKGLPKITDKMAAPLVQDFEVESGERTSATRYIARLGFRFKPAGVRALLASSNVHYVATRAPTVLVLPVYRAATGDLLWQPANPWRAAWKDASTRAGLVPIVVPEGSEADIRDLTLADLQNADKMAAIAARYKAEPAVVIVATAISSTGQPGEGLRLTFTDGGGPDESLTSPGAASAAAALSSGVATSLQHLDDLWKQHALKGTNGAVAFKGGGRDAPADGTDAAEEPAAGNHYAVRAQFTGPGDWADLRGKLGKLTGISHVELKSLTRDRAVLVLTVPGDEDALAHILGAAGLSLGAAEAVTADDPDLSASVPSDGPGAGLIYPLASNGAVP